MKGVDLIRHCKFKRKLILIIYSIHISDILEYYQESTEKLLWQGSLFIILFCIIQVAILNKINNTLVYNSLD